ncbi:MAG: hypothetical protein ACRCZ0_02420 [Cetobacterium sp.]
MKDLIELTNLLITNSILIKAIVFAIVSEAVIYFGIRNSNEHRLFNISVFIALQIAVNTIFSTYQQITIVSGIGSIILAFLILLLLNFNWSKSLLMKTRTLILMNGWDTLGKKASLESPVLVRITFNNGDSLYGVFAAKSNISFSNNRLGIFLEKLVILDNENNFIIDEKSEGFWISDSNIFMIELVSKIDSD